MNLNLANQLVQRRVEAAMVSTVQIYRGNLGDMDSVTLNVGGMASATSIYLGKAHVHNVTGAGVINVGESPIDTRMVRISIPAAAAMPWRDDLVKVVADNDTDLPSRTFRVMDVDGGGLLSSWHTMTCQGWFQSRLWF